MRKLILSEFITLDGVIEAPGGEPGFKYTGWSADYFDEDYLKYKLDEINAADALLLGRKTYEGFAEAWPDRDDTMGFAKKMNTMPKYVASTTLKELAWKNSTLIQGDVAEAVRKLKADAGDDILVHGSGTLAQTLMQHDLIDEYRLMVHPTMLGIGGRLYRDIGERKRLKLIGPKVFRSGTVVLEYRPVD